MHIEPPLDLVMGLLLQNGLALVIAPIVILPQQVIKTLIAAQH